MARDSDGFVRCAAASAGLVCGLAVVAGCGGDEARSLPPLALPAGCNPLASPGDCLLPYPSDVFRVADEDTAGGSRVRLSGAAIPVVRDGTSVDLLALHPNDGFSPGAQILVLLPGGVDPVPLVGAADDLARSLEDESPTRLIDVETGERVLHLAELDPRADEDARRALVLRPMVPLQMGRRYAVAIRGLDDRAGVPVAPPEGFRRLRDRETRDDPALEELADRYEVTLFPALAADGLERSELILAWDFTVASEEVLTRDLDRIRDDLARRLATAPPEVRVVAVEEDVDAHVARRVEATMRVPLYLTRPGPGGRLTRDAAGEVTPRGEIDIPFTVIVPRSVAAAAPGSAPARLLQYGHGFFGSRREANGSFVTGFADEHRFVVVVADWWGMAFEDQLQIGADILFGPERTMRFVERLHQGYANFVALGAVATGPLADLEALQRDGAPLFDASELYYYGISQGAILGGTYLAMSPHVRRAVLGVGGACYPLMMFRALPFETFLALIGVQTDDPLVQQEAVATIQGSFDRVDPLTYAPRVLTRPWAGAPADRRVLLQIGIGDAQVPNLSAHLHARALGVPLVEPAPRPVVGLERVGLPHAGSGLVEVDFGIDPLPDDVADLPAADNEVHEGVRRVPAAADQVDRFLTPAGLIEATCQGPCDPE